jgi:dolichol kinase
MIRKYENKIKFLHLTIFLATLLELRMESGEFFLIRFFKEIWRLKKLTPLLKKIAKKKKKKKNSGMELNWPLIKVKLAKVQMVNLVFWQKKKKWT